MYWDYIFAENLVSMQVSPPTAVTGKEEKMQRRILS